MGPGAALPTVRIVHSNSLLFLESVPETSHFRGEVPDSAVGIAAAHSCRSLSQRGWCLGAEAAA